MDSQNILRVLKRQKVLERKVGGQHINDQVFAVIIHDIVVDELEADFARCVVFLADQLEE